MVGYSHEENVRDARAMAAMFQALDTLPVPLIGRVHGAALGGGAGLAAVCDIVVAAEDAMFGFTEAKLGILPAVISPFVDREDRRVGGARAVPHRRALLAQRARARSAWCTPSSPRPTSTRRVERYVRELLTSAPEADRGGEGADRAGRRPAAGARSHDLTAETIAAQRVSRRRPGRHARVPREAAGALDARWP